MQTQSPALSVNGFFKFASTAPPEVIHYGFALIPDEAIPAQLFAVLPTTGIFGYYLVLELLEVCPEGVFELAKVLTGVLF